MSATGRNRKGKERREADFYPTPAFCTNALLAEVKFSRMILDPAAGEGAILDAVSDWDMADGSPFITLGLELDERRADIAAKKHRVYCADALTDSWPQCDAVITNPPYSLASEFVARAMGQAPSVPKAFLLPLGFLGSEGRVAMHRGYPSDLYVIPRRPSFTGDGQTDAEVYGWFVWSPRGGGRWKVLEVDL
jgi:hypothetical protein